MATNIGPGTNFSNNADPGEGVLGNLYNRATRARFNREIWGTGNDDGVLQNSLRDIEQLQKELTRISKDRENFDNKSIKKAKELLNLLKDQKFLTEKMINIGEASDSEAIARAKELRNVELDTLQRVKKLIQENSKLSDDEREKSNAFYLNEMQKFKNLGNQINRLEKDLSKGTSNTLKSIGNSMSNLGDTLTKLTNMFNLDRLANNAFEQSARSKLAIQNQLTRQYGISSNQFSSFRSSMFGNLKSLNSATGNLFNSNDMLSYMQRLDKYNITNMKIAEQQMKSSIMATKYLSVSDETQTNIFKFMKATNDYSMLDGHNKTITGILKSQLGVSTDQLDQLTQLVQSTQDVQFASGMSVDAMNKYQESSTVLASVLSSQLGDSYAKSISTALGKMVSASYSDMPGLVQAYGVTLDDIRRLQETGDVFSIYNKLLSSSGYNRYNITGTTMGTNEVINQLGGDVGVIGAMRASTGKEAQIQEDYLKAVKNIKDGTQSIEDYIQSTTELTAAEKIYNLIDSYFSDIAWKKTIDLANIAFGVMIGGEFLKGIGSLVDIGKAVKDFGGLKNLFSSSLGLGGTSLASLLSSGAIVVGLTTATMIGIGNAVQKSNRTGESTYEQSIVNSLKTEGSSYANNKAFTSALATKNQTSQQTGFGTAMGSVSGGFSTLWANLSGKSHIERNKIFLDWAKDSGSFGTGDTAALNTLAYYYLLDEVNSLESVSGLTHDDLKQLVKNGSFEQWNLQKYIDNVVNGGWHPEDINHNKATGKNTIDRYLKAGLNWIPRDGFRAMLHKGEMVLNAQQADHYRKAMGIDRYGNGYGGSLSPSDSDYVGPHHSGYAGHNGIDLYFGDIGTPVGSAVAGKVIDSNDIPVNWSDGKKFHGKDSSGIAYSSYGRYVKVLGDDGHTYIYAHLNERAVNTGDVVSAGTLLGYSGTTGNSSGPHLHFEVKGAGIGEANHAKYYTPYVRNVIGTASSSLANASLVGVDRIDNDSKVSVNSRRFIPKIFSENMGAGGDSASRITNSVDGGFRNLISYLESIRSEQETQRAMIEAFSNSRLS